MGPTVWEKDGIKSDGENKLPVLKNLGVNIDSWDKETNRAGDILFRRAPYPDNKIFTEAGLLVRGPQGLKRLPEMTFFLPRGTKVFSAVDGFVEKIDFWEDSKDYGVHIKTDKNSLWMLSYEHLVNLRIKEGDMVKVGQVVGEVSPYKVFSEMDDETGVFEIVVWKGGSTFDDIVKVCPFLALEDSLKPVYEEKITTLAREWEEFIGEDVYNESAWVAPGCLIESMTEREVFNPK